MNQNILKLLFGITILISIGCVPSIQFKSNCCPNASDTGQPTYTSPELIPNQISSCDLESSVALSSNVGEPTMVFQGTVTNNGDDDARNNSIIINVPPESVVLGFNAQKGKSSLECVQCGAVIICRDYGNLGVGDSISFEIQFSEPRSPLVGRCGVSVYAYANWPADNDSKNNFASVPISCP